MGSLILGLFPLNTIGGGTAGPEIPGRPTDMKE
jgi:hypothetical protein